MLTGVWGYDNTGTESITISAGSENNYFLGSNSDSGQPSTFYPGRHTEVFRVPLTSAQQTWVVKYHQQEQDTASIYTSSKMFDGGEVAPLRAADNPRNTYRRGIVQSDVITNRRYIAPHYYKLLGIDPKLDVNIPPQVIYTPPTPIQNPVVAKNVPIRDSIPTEETSSNQAKWYNQPPIVDNRNVIEARPSPIQPNIVYNYPDQAPNRKEQPTNTVKRIEEQEVYRAPYGGNVIDHKIYSPYNQVKKNYLHENILGESTNFYYKT